jgi:hypothetical protein
MPKIKNIFDSNKNNATKNKIIFSGKKPLKIILIFDEYLTVAKYQ